MKYTNKFLLYIDILGFTHYISESVTDNDLLRRLFSAIEKPSKIESEQYILLDIGDLSQTEVEISHFSDTVVLTTEDSYRGLLYLLMYSIKVYYRLIKLNLYFRGSIVSGQIIHTKDNIIGPSLIKAYNLEQNIAKYPRVIIDESALYLIDNETKERQKYIKRFIRNDDTDNQKYVHVLFAYGQMKFEVNQCNELFKSINYNIEKAKKIVDSELSISIISKYIWFSNYMSDVTGKPNLELLSILLK